MGLNWVNEPWRKLYTRVTGTWLRLPVSARGLANELIKYAVDDGSVTECDDEDPGLAIAYMLGAKPKEHDRIREDVAVLIKDGYLIVEAGRVHIRNFVDAQTRRSPSAVKQARYRDRTKQDGNEPGNDVGNAGGNETGNADGNETGNARYPAVTDTERGQLPGDETRRDDSQKKENSAPTRVIEPVPHPDYGWFHGQWCKASGALISDAAGTKLVFSLILEYAMIAKRPICATCDDALAAYAKVIAKWDTPLWSASLFNKHWETVQCFMVGGKRTKSSLLDRTSGDA